MIFGAAFFYITGALFFAGLVAAIVAWRGKRVDDHPVCKRCRQDLTGIDIDSSACPECGSRISLLFQRGVRIGNRETRKFLRAVAIVCLLVTGSLLGGVGYLTYSDIDVYQYIPLPLLLSQLDSADANVAKRANDELSRRYVANGFSFPPEQDRQIIEKGLALQADTDARWNELWGAYMVDAIVAGRTTDAQSTRFFENVSEFHFRAREKVRAGAELPFDMWWVRRGAPGNTRTTSTWYERAGFKQVRIVGGPVLYTLPRLGSLGGHGVHGSGSAGTMSWSCKVPADTQPGKYTLELVYVRFVEVGFESGKKLLEPRERSYEIPLEVLPPDVPSARAVESDPDLDRKMRASFTLGQSHRFSTGEAPPHVEVRTPGGGSSYMQIRVGAVDPPAPTVFDVFLRFDGGELHRVSEFRFEAEKVHGWGTSHELPEGGSNLSRVDVILRSSIEAAERTTEYYEVWEGEIVFDDVKVVE